MALKQPVGQKRLTNVAVVRALAGRKGWRVPVGGRVWKLGCIPSFQILSVGVVSSKSTAPQWWFVSMKLKCGMLVIFTTAFLTADTTQVYEINNCVTCAITCYSILLRPPNYCCSHTSSRNKSLVTVRYIGWSIVTYSGLLYTSYIYTVDLGLNAYR